MSTPLDPIYCRKCRKAMPPDKPFCPSCGWDQSKYFDADADRQRQHAEEQEARQRDDKAYEERRRREVDEDMKAPKPDAPGAFSAGGSLNPQNPYTSEEYTKQYTTLYWYIAFSIIGLITGPIAIALFVYALIQQSALRRKVAEMGINPDELTRAASARFWNTASPILLIGAKIVAALAILLVVVVSLSASSVGCGRRRSYGEHDPRLLATWRYQGGGDTNVERRFFSDGTGFSYIWLDGIRTKGAEIEWHSENERLYARYKSTLKPDPEWSEEMSEKYQFFSGDGAIRLTDDLGAVTAIRVPD